MRKNSFLKNLTGLAIFILLAVLNVLLFSRIVEASTNISSDAASHWAWNDLIGWVDFYNTNTITVSSFNLTGYASSSAGDVSLDCHTTENGNICGQSNYQVTNDGSGNLSGWGWNDQYGWVSFDCHNSGGCSTSSYEVYIDSSGNFQNYAWSDAAGWISFNCANTGSCGTSNYKVLTSWVATSAIGYADSTTFDTQATSGAQINSVLWHGSLPAGTSVRFQFAVSNSSSGPWTYVGSDGTGNTYYAAAVDTSVKLDYTLFNNYRYFRYRTTLVSDQAQRKTPRVDEVLINWSP